MCNVFCMFSQRCCSPPPSVQALLLSHKRKDVRDTSRYPPLMREQASSSRARCATWRLSSWG